MTANEAQQAFWNGPAGEGWVAGQADIDRSLAALSGKLLDAAAAQPGERILDVGCGCGTTTLALAESGATVRGVDISKPMTDYATTRAEGQDNISFSCEDASVATFEPHHNLVFSRFGVMFFDDPVTAFTNLRTALVPGGRLVFLCWQAAAENAWVSIPGRALAPFLDATPPGDPRAPGPFAFGDISYLTSVINDAGFADVSISPVTAEFFLGEDLASAVSGQRRNGPLSRQLAEVPEDQLDAALAAISAALEPFATNEGVLVPSATWLVEARQD